MTYDNIAVADRKGGSNGTMINGRTDAPPFILK
jgi:hypothetical protein